MIDFEQLTLNLDASQENTFSWLHKLKEVAPCSRVFVFSAKEAKHTLLSCPGLYMMMGKSGEPLYIGKSSLICSRLFRHETLKNHRKNGVYRVAVAVDNIEKINEKEKELIRHFRPRLNGNLYGAKRRK